MATLEKRIEALEQANPDNGLPKTIFITFMSPGDAKAEIHKLRADAADGDCREWVRGPNESERELQDRASKEVHQIGRAHV